MTMRPPSAKDYPSAFINVPTIQTNTTRATEMNLNLMIAEIMNEIYRCGAYEEIDGERIKAALKYHGYQIVPIEPSEAILRAGAEIMYPEMFDCDETCGVECKKYHEKLISDFRKDYKAVLEAAAKEMGS